MNKYQIKMAAMANALFEFGLHKMANAVAQEAGAFRKFVAGKNVNDMYKRVNTLGGAAIGGAVGGVGGAIVGAVNNEDDRLGGALKGGLGGAAGGAAIGGLGGYHHATSRIDAGKISPKLEGVRNNLLAGKPW